jgi:CRP/FNR family transcriptional regulator, cyclic AMP receptor protein
MLLRTMATKRAEQLKRVPLFSHCSSRDLDFIATRLDEVSLPAGKTLIVEGKPTDAFYILLSGEVDVSVRGKTRARLRAGDFFGEIGMLDRGNAVATVKTNTPVDVLVLSHPQFRDAIKGNDTLSMKVIAAMAERLRANNPSA